MKTDRGFRYWRNLALFGLSLVLLLAMGVSSEVARSSADTVPVRSSET